MIHLKDKVNDKKDLIESVNIKSANIDNISEILKIIRNKSGSIEEFIEEDIYNKLIESNYIFSDGAVCDRYFFKMIENCNFNEYIIESDEFIGTFIESEDLKIDKNKDYLFIYDDDMTLMIPVIKVHNNNEEYYRVYIDDVIHVKEFLLQKCDGCSCNSLKELLFILYPEINTGLNEKYSDFTGMVCSECLSKMEKGSPLANESEEVSKDKKGDVMEKIDEFSSIEDILKFCGMNDKKELEQALKNKLN